MDSRFTKDRGSAGPWPGDADTGDGQGASTESRARSANRLARIAAAPSSRSRVTRVQPLMSAIRNVKTTVDRPVSPVICCAQSWVNWTARRWLIVLKVRAQCYSVEAANPQHEYEWHVWETAKLPSGKTLMPGAVGHATNVVEHPETVADRLLRYASVVGRENVTAGTDCGIGTRVGHPEIAWAKLEALVEGARIASRQLWG